MYFLKCILVTVLCRFFDDVMPVLWRYNACFCDVKLPVLWRYNPGIAMVQFRYCADITSALWQHQAALRRYNIEMDTVHWLAHPVFLCDIALLKHSVKLKLPKKNLKQTQLFLNYRKEIKTHNLTFITLNGTWVTQTFTKHTRSKKC